jgi:hypothetical protein
VQAVAGEQAVQAAVPFAYVPTGHVVAVKTQAVAPAALNAPAAQGAHAAEELAPEKEENLPAAHGVQVEGAAAPTKELYVPARHLVQTDIKATPVALDHVPAGQGIGFTEERGQ